MPKVAKALKPTQINVLQPRRAPYAVGGVPGLMVRVTERKDGTVARTYLLKYTDKNGRREMSLGEVSLGEARSKAKDLRKMIDAGRSPLAEREEEQRRVKARVKVLTFEQCALQWLDAFEQEKRRFYPDTDEIKGLKIRKAVSTARGILVRDAFPVFGSKPIREVEATDICVAVERLYVAEKRATAQHLRMILRKVFAFAQRSKYLDASAIANPMVLAQELLRGAPKPKSPIDNRAAVDIAEAPRLYEELRSDGSMACLAIAFALLTGARPQALRFARWDEIDFEGKVWHIPLEHDKKKDQNAQREIFLSDEAVSFLQAVPRIEGGRNLIFPSPRGGSALCECAFTQALQRLHKARFKIDGQGWIDKKKAQRHAKHCRITAYGARCALRTWARSDEHGNNRRFDQKAAELCLLHEIKDTHHQAYERTDLRKSRREIMHFWGVYLATGKWPDEVAASSVAALPIKAANNAA